MRVYIFTIILVFCSFFASGKDSLKFTSDLWCPYVCQDNRLGYAVELSQKAAELMAVDSSFQFQPLARGVKRTKQGQADAVLALSKELIVKEGLIPNSVAIGGFYYDYYVKQDNPWRYSGPESLINTIEQGASLGLIKDYFYSDFVHDLEQQNPAQVFRQHGNHPLLTNLRLINRGRIDILIDSRITVEYHSAFHQIQPLQFAGSEGVLFELFVGFSPETEQSTINRFDNNLHTLLNSHYFAELIKKYRIPDWRQLPHTLNE